MKQKKQKKLFILVILACVISLLLTIIAFVILPETNLALGSFF